MSNDQPAAWRNFPGVYNRLAPPLTPAPSDVARMEAAMSTPEMFGRVAIAQTMRDVSPDLMDILGAASALPVGTDGAADEGGAEYVFRLAGPTGIYGGTLEVFRNMIAQHALGLGKPNYSQAR